MRRRLYFNHSEFLRRPALILVLSILFLVVFAIYSDINTTKAAPAPASYFPTIRRTGVNSSNGKRPNIDANQKKADLHWSIARIYNDSGKRTCQKSNGARDAILVEEFMVGTQTKSGTTFSNTHPWAAAGNARWIGLNNDGTHEGNGLAQQAGSPSGWCYDPSYDGNSPVPQGPPFNGRQHGPPAGGEVLPNNNGGNYANWNTYVFRYKNISSSSPLVIDPRVDMSTVRLTMRGMADNFVGVKVNGVPMNISCDGFGSTTTDSGSVPMCNRGFSNINDEFTATIKSGTNPFGTGRITSIEIYVKSSRDLVGLILTGISLNGDLKDDPSLRFEHVVNSRGRVIAGGAGGLRVKQGGAVEIEASLCNTGNTIFPASVTSELSLRLRTPRNGASGTVFTRGTGPGDYPSYAETFMPRTEPGSTALTAGGGINNMQDSRWTIKTTAGVPGHSSASANCSNPQASAVGGFGRGRGWTTVRYNVPDNAPLGDYCFRAAASPASATQTTVSSSDICFTVVIDPLETPYTKFYGNDVFVGGNFAGKDDEGNELQSCDPFSPAAGIFTYQDEATRSNQLHKLASSVQYAAFALGEIQQFHSAGTRLGTGEPPLAPHGNWTNGIPTNIPAGLIFGNFDGSGSGKKSIGDYGKFRCVRDYFADAPTQQNITGSHTVNLNSTPGGEHHFSPTGITTISGTVSSSKQTTVYIDGNVYIGGNIVLGDYGAIPAIPSFRLVVRGDIRIAPTVTRLDGVYIAQPMANGTRGEISTCALLGGFFSGATGTTRREWYNNCNNNRLVVNGAFIAKKVRLDRTYGQLSASMMNSTSAYETVGITQRAAEVFRFLPEFFLTDFGGNTPGSSSKTYDSIISLPPIL